jgi:hypothetical protein
LARPDHLDINAIASRAARGGEGTLKAGMHCRSTILERDDFRIEAALRKMSYKELLLASLQLYSDTYPVPGR